MCPVLLAVVTLVFLMLHVMPGDPARLALGAEASVQDVARLRTKLGLDQPIYRQYANFLGGLLHGDLGTSYVTGRPVINEAWEALTYTIQLALVALAISVLLGIPLGVAAATRPNSIISDTAMALSVLGVSIPAFWLGLLLMLVFALWLDLLPSAGAGSWKNIILPGITLATWSLGTVARMTRASMIEVIGSDYIRTARAKGLGEATVVWSHALRNALIPIITMIGLRLGYMMGGAVATETVFSWPGLGRYIVSAILARDYPSVQVGILLFSISFLVINLLVDIAYAMVDPRIKY
jgi:ABC-type dipeptide/oligopeptide/nickel transport system permease component